MHCGAAHALESDRQQPLKVDAQQTEGSLGDGATVLKGQVEIRQGSLLITADEAEVIKNEGKVTRVTFTGSPATLEQEIEEQGMVNAEANRITYEVSAGTVKLAGKADVNHPQYQISGDVLTYDLDTQHFEGSGSDSGDGRISIRLEPEVASDLQKPPTEPAPDDAGSNVTDDPDN
jgi:lipopolysaccharide export system protein LptA